MTIRLRTTILAGAVASAPLLLAAQPAGAQAVVQALPPPALADLNSALKDLARSPRSVPVLLRAAWASLELNDTQAALGFFQRAEAVEPASGEVKAGKAVIELRQGDPVASVRLFDEAERAGVRMARFAGDRGLAHDLVGDNAGAQRFYREALAEKDDADVIRRLAVSQAISGDQRASEATLLPLLQRTDLAAYRSRAFALAILGKSEEAVSIAETMLPGSLSNRMAPYLRYMPRLTRAQQAAAANLGRFPPADQIGRDAPAIAALSQQAAPPVQVAARTPDARLAPSGQPLGASAATASATRSTRSTRRQEPAAQPVPGLQPPPSTPWPSRDSQVAQNSTPAPTPAAVSSAAKAPAALLAPVTQAPARVTAAQTGASVAQPVASAGTSMVKVFEAPPGSRPAATPATQPALTPPPSTAPVVVARAAAAPGELPPVGTPPQVTQAVPPPSEAPRPTLSVAVPASAAAAAPLPTPTSTPAPAPVSTPPAQAVVETVPDQRTLAEAFADFSQPASVALPTNAVDITKIAVKREKPPVKEEAKAPEKPKPPVNPSRVWVQVATGRDTKALGFDWRRIMREAGPLLSKKEPYVAKWGQTNRLLTGPYATDSEAQKAVSELKKKGLDSFTFTSDEGEAVNPLK